MKKFFLVGSLVFCVFLFSGCFEFGGDDDGDDPAPASTGSSSSSGLPFTLSQVTWLHADVSGWAETGTLHSVSVSGDTISLPYDKANVWPSVDNVNANCWIFVQQDGTWYAGTWEYLRKGQTAKAKRAVNGDHIKQAPLQNFSPRSGTQYGFMISGLARSAARNVQERTNIVMYTWP